MQSVTATNPTVERLLVTVSHSSATLDRPASEHEGPPQHGRTGGQSVRTFALGGTTALVILTGLASATNYASNLIFSRLLTPASFGDLAALLALVVVITVPASAGQTIGAERIAALVASGETDRMRRMIRHGLAHVAVLSGICAIVAAISAPLIYEVLDLQAIGAALALVPLLAVSLFIPVVWGLLQGFDRFVALGTLMFVAAVSRIAFGAPWAAAGGGAGGALAGQALGNAFAVGVTLWLLRDHLIGRGTGAATTGVRRRPDVRTVSASVAFIAFALLSNLDLLMAKLFLDGNAAGEYAALATIGKIVIFLPSAVAVVMVPGIARARLRDGSTSNVLRKGGALVITTTLLAAIPIALFPDLVLTTMFGDEYAGAAGGVRAITVAGFGLALLYLLVVYTVAIQDRRWIFILGGAVVAQVLAIASFHENATEIATIQAAVIVAALAVNELLFHPILRAERWVIGRRPRWRP